MTARAHDFQRSPGQLADVGPCAACGEGPLSPRHPVRQVSAVALIAAADGIRAKAQRTDDMLVLLADLQDQIGAMQQPGEPCRNVALAIISAQVGAIIARGCGYPPPIGLRGTLQPAA